MPRPKRQSRDQKRGARDYARRPARRNIPNRILVVCEDSKSSVAYFKALIRELKILTACVTVYGEGGSSPERVIADGAALLQKDPDFEQVYFVIDRDEYHIHGHYAQAFCDAASLQAHHPDKTIALIPSVPCYEIWLLMHCQDCAAPFERTGKNSPADMVIQALKKNAPFAGYDKGTCDFFDAIASNRAQAKTRAIQRLVQAHKNGEAEFHENPSTRIHILIEALEKAGKR